MSGERDRRRERGAWARVAPRARTTVHRRRVSPCRRRRRVGARVRRGRVTPAWPTRRPAAARSPAVECRVSTVRTASRASRRVDRSEPAPAGRPGGGVPPSLHAPPPVHPHRRWRGLAREEPVRNRAAPRLWQDPTRAEGWRESRRSPESAWGEFYPADSGTRRHGRPPAMNRDLDDWWPPGRLRAWCASSSSAAQQLRRVQPHL